ncbi:hypothetical protein FHP29_00995 [Nocardioides albidus]|uniref:Uncharacterized protein n=1 Tax=Nocardioides albidus TaxID=1517589 RepID=A0A5C4WP92_9ACTN|nr:hypothetical protein [Nocardioides albidus]TNM50138.1 hypothetical protein FHP29_00995 [Nocardioides albidus]
MKGRLRATRIALGAVLATATFAGVAQASPSPTTTSTAKVDCVVYDEAAAKCTVTGVVYAITQIGDTTYIGGAFAAVNGEPRANLAAVRADGSLDPIWTPSTDGTVYALAASADGSKVYVGGSFAAVDGQPRRLAAVTADTGALVGGWTTTTSNNTVRALAADTTGRLYVGGSFSRIGGRAIARLAAVDQATGAVDAAFAPQPNNTVRALGLTDDGTRLYAGGSFSTMGGLPRPGAAELTPAGATTAFAPTEGGVAISLDVSPTGRLFFGTTNNRTWAYDPTVSSLPLYRVRTSGDVQAILATADEVYIGGHFSGFPEAHLDRLHIGSFLAANGTPTAWNPGANGSYGVWAFGLTDGPPLPGSLDALSVGGDFTRTAGAARRGYARFPF